MKVIKLAIRNAATFEKTKARCVPVEYNGKTCYTSLPLVCGGNSKLGSNVAMFSLMAGLSCHNCRDCIKSCYARKAERQYPNTWDKRLLLTHMAYNDLEKLELMLDAQLSIVELTGSQKYVRVHESGDFVSQAYVDMWARLARKHQGLKFYAYTKVYDMFDFSTIDYLSNFNLINSILDGGSKNFGTKEYCVDKLQTVAKGGIICPNKHCGTECTLCMRKGVNNVLFIQH